MAYARKEDHARWHRVKNAELRVKVLAGYGSSCACCGENEPWFLTIDHVAGGGCKERRFHGQGTLLRKIIRENFPKSYRVLCYNCNSGRARNNGVCPHEIRRAIGAAA